MNRCRRVLRLFICDQSKLNGGGPIFNNTNLDSDSACCDKNTLDFWLFGWWRDDNVFGEHIWDFITALE